MVAGLDRPRKLEIVAIEKIRGTGRGVYIAGEAVLHVEEGAAACSGPRGRVRAPRESATSSARREWRCMVEGTLLLCASSGMRGSGRREWCRRC